MQVFKKAASKGKTNGKTEEAEYDCQEDDVVYLYRAFPDLPAGYKNGEKTDTWQACQKQCAEIGPCKGFTWHKENNRFAKQCALFSTYHGKKGGDTTVSGLKECPKDL